MLWVRLENLFSSAVRQLVLGTQDSNMFIFLFTWGFLIVAHQNIRCGKCPVTKSHCCRVESRAVGLLLAVWNVWTLASTGHTSKCPWAGHWTQSWCLFLTYKYLWLKVSDTCKLSVYQLIWRHTDYWHIYCLIKSLPLSTNGAVIKYSCLFQKAFTSYTAMINKT